MKAEIRRVLKTVVIRLSHNSNNDISNYVRLMFPDNAIAEQFSLGRNKSTYVVINGLSPYLKELLTENIYLSNCFLIYFAECFSSVI